MVTVKINGKEVEGSAADIAAILNTMAGGGVRPAGGEPWRWTDDAVEELIQSAYGPTMKVLRAFVEHGRTLSYTDLCKYSGRRGLELVGPLSALRKRARKAVGHKQAQLVYVKWTVPGDREKRQYSIHADAYDRLCELVRSKAGK